MSDIPFGADTLACARPAAPVKAGRLAAPLCGVSLTGADRGALRSHTEALCGEVRLVPTPRPRPDAGGVELFVLRWRLIRPESFVKA
jgi:hypothetical protein